MVLLVDGGTEVVLVAVEELLCVDEGLVVARNDVSLVSIARHVDLQVLLLNEDVLKIDEDDDNDEDAVVAASFSIHDRSMGW